MTARACGKTCGMAGESPATKKERMIGMDNKLASIDKEEILARFRRYVEIPTNSDEGSETSPSTEKQWVLAKELVRELEELGFANVRLTEFCYVLAELPATTDKELPVMGLISHVDTSSEAADGPLDMQIHENYDGSALELSPGRILDPEMFPELKDYVGQTLITTDGKTLLGADDKAGICGIVSACAYLLAHPEIPHGKILVAFTPDEEIGRGTAHFPYDDFPAEFAYTVDGGAVGELNYETFNACNAKVEFTGISVHPGSSKHMMRNAIKMANEFLALLPAGEAPEYTENYEGFYHPVRIQGGVEKAVLELILRDHDRAILEKRKAYMEACVELLEKKYGKDTVKCDLKDIYCNMREYIEPVYGIVQRAMRAYRAAGVEPNIEPVRGGTDGSVLSANGLPCPNIFTGGHNFHGSFEYITLESMEKLVQVLVELVTDNGEAAK